MALSSQLGHRQTTQLTVSTDLRRAIHLLSLPNMSLGTYLRDICCENPLIEVEEPLAEDPFREEFQERSSSKTSNTASENFDPTTVIPDRGPSLYAHIESQIERTFTENMDKALAHLCLHHLDQTGYCRISLEDFSKKLGVSLKKVKKVFERLQTFDPAGVFAPNLTTCLKNQWHDKNIHNPMDPNVFQQVLRVLDHLSLYEKGNIPLLCKKTSMDRSQLAHCLQHIQTLNPWPVKDFIQDHGPHLPPDLVIHPHQGTWHVKINEATLPRVLLDQQYAATLESSPPSSETKKYLKKCLQSGHFIKRALDQRQKTLILVTKTILEHQKDFLEKGLSALRPLSMSDIASVTGHHESTISRAMAHKTLLTPRGLVPLRLFVCSKVQSLTGEETHAQSKVITLLKHVIQTEDPKNPFSDDALVLKCAEAGVDVARRTVVKYRRQGGIPSSYERKRQERRKLSC